MADILGNNYIEGVYDAQQQCISDLKIKLREEMNSFMEEVSDSKANFESFLEQHSDELTQDELEGLCCHREYDAFRAVVSNLFHPWSLDPITICPLPPPPKPRYNCGILWNVESRLGHTVGNVVIFKIE